MNDFQQYMSTLQDIENNLRDRPNKTDKLFIDPRCYDRIIREYYHRCPTGHLTEGDIDRLSTYTNNKTTLHDLLHNKLLDHKDFVKVANEKYTGHHGANRRALISIFDNEEYLINKYNRYSIIRIDINNTKLNYENNICITLNEYKSYINEFLAFCSNIEGLDIILGHHYTMEMGEHSLHCHLHLYLDCTEALGKSLVGSRAWLRGKMASLEIAMYSVIGKGCYDEGRNVVYLKSYCLEPTRVVISKESILERNLVRIWLSYIAKESRTNYYYRLEKGKVRLYGRNEIKIYREE